MFIWIDLAPPRVESCLLTVTGKIPTFDNPRRQGIALEYISNICALGKNMMELVCDPFHFKSELLVLMSRED